MGRIKKIRLIIRADSNKKIAMGHVMRCLSIADAVKTLGGDVMFVTASSDPRDLILSRGYACTVMDTKFDDTMGELDRFIPIIKGHAPDMVLCDGYYFSKEYFEAVNKYAYTAFVDDYGKWAFPVNLLVNYNIYGPDIDYAGMFKREKTDLPRLLLGTKYMPLRQAFIGVKSIKIKKDGPINILVSTGGADLCGIAKAVTVGYIRNPIPNTKLGILVGPFSKDREYLEGIAKRYGNLEIYQNITDMPGFLENFDIALSASGSTTYELCRMGIPTCLFSSADNQNRINETFKKKKICDSAGNAEKNKQEVVEKLLYFAKVCSSSYMLRASYSAKMTDTVDAMGAIRIAETILDMV